MTHQQAQRIIEARQRFQEADNNMHLAYVAGHAGEDAINAAEAYTEAHDELQAAIKDSKEVAG